MIERAPAFADVLMVGVLKAAEAGCVLAANVPSTSI